MQEQLDQRLAFMQGSLLLSEFAAERHEILKHKWIESEKAREDIGFERALVSWMVQHRSRWLEERKRNGIAE